MDNSTQRITWGVDFSADLPVPVDPEKWIASQLRLLAEELEHGGFLPPDAGYGGAEITDGTRGIVGWHHGMRTSI